MKYIEYKIDYSKNSDYQFIKSQFSDKLMEFDLTYMYFEHMSDKDILLLKLTVARPGDIKEVSKTKQIIINNIHQKTIFNINNIWDTW